ncbi:MAG: hypothetical protein AABM40_13800 [Chloroflexota bacterium]
MKLSRLASVASAYRGRLAFVPIVAALLALSASLALSPRYAAMSTVQLTTADGEPFSAQGIAAMLQSREVADIIVDDLKLDARPAPAGIDAIRGSIAGGAEKAWTLLRFGYVAGKVGRDASVELVRSSVTMTVLPDGYLAIGASADDPRLASALANEAVEAVVKRSNTLTSAAADRRASFLGSQVVDAKRRVDGARSAMLSYAVLSNTVAGDSVRNGLAALDSGRAALSASELGLADARSRLSAVEQELSRTPAQTVSVTQGTDRTITSTASPIYVSLQDRANALRQEIAALDARRAQVEATIKGDDQAFSSLLTRDSQLAALNQEVVLANQRYSQLSNDLATAQFDLARPATPVRVVQSAVPPDYPIFPERTTFLGAGFGAGALAAVVLLLILAGSDRSVRSRQEIEAILGDVPLLAVVPPRGKKVSKGA